MFRLILNNKMSHQDLFIIFSVNILFFLAIKDAGYGDFICETEDDFINDIIVISILL